MCIHVESAHLLPQEGWYEKLHRWDEALRAYRDMLANALPHSDDYWTALKGCCRYCSLP